MSAIPEQTWTAEQYLALERESEERHEYLSGHIYLMAGASRDHIRITGNTFASLHSQVRKRPCEVYQSEMRIRVNPSVYYYPDVTVVCGEPEFEDGYVDTLLNPVVIIEVLSPSTEKYDRGRKFQSYRTITSLQEYLLISQDSPRIEHYARQPNEQWILTDLTQPESVLELASVGCTLALADVYEKVTFQDTDAEQSSTG